MKKLFVLAATVVLAVGFVGCAKEDSAPAMKDIKVEFSVADKDGFAETRAVKNAWADGDQILILFRPNPGTWLGTENSKDNTLTLTYSKSVGWYAIKNNWSEALTNSTKGFFLAVHYRGDMALGAKIDNSSYYFNYTAGEVLVQQDGIYTITDGVMDLGTLALKLRDGAVQFSVQSLASNSDDWEMWVTFDNEISYQYPNDATSPVGGYNENKVFYTLSSGHIGKYSSEWMSNVINGDDRSFFGYLDSANDRVTEKYIFVLKNETNDKYYKFEYAPSPFAKLTKGAYLLPPLTLEADGVTPATGCLWSIVE